MSKVKILILVSCFLISNTLGCAEGEERLAASVCIPANYTKGQIPNEPTPVFVEFEIDQYPEVDDFKKTMSTHLHILTEWKEPRFCILFFFLNAQKLFHLV
jgi:hypothetical protein